MRAWGARGRGPGREERREGAGRAPGGPARVWRLADASGARARMSEVAGERRRRGPTVLRVPDAEAASGDTTGRP